MGLHDRVSHRWVFRHGVSQSLASAGLGETFFEAMTEVVHRHQTVQIPLHAFGESLVGRGHAGEQGIAAHFGNGDASQSRSPRVGAA